MATNSPSKVFRKRNSTSILGWFVCERTSLYEFSHAILRLTLTWAFAVFIGATAMADPPTDNDLKIVLTDEQAEIWLKRVNECGDIEGDQCKSEFRAILNHEQTEVFDEMLRRSRDKNKKKGKGE